MEINMSMNSNERLPVSDGAKFNKTTKAKSARKNGRFNFIDAILILLILAVVAAIVAYFLPGISSYFDQGEDYDITYVIEFRGVDSEFVSKILADDVVYDSTYNYKIGTVTAVENDNYNVLTYNEESGVAEYKPHPELKNIIVTVVGKAKYTAADGFLINGQRIAVGKLLHVKFPEFSGSGYCIDVALSDY